MRGTRWGARNAVISYTGLYEGRWRLVVFDDGRSMLFDLDVDPGERHDRSGTDRPQAEAMRDRLESAARHVPHGGSSEDPRHDLEERLQAAGYVW